MRVLVSAASKHGATCEIGESIAGVLRDRGLEVTVAPPDDVHDIRWYDAIVLGSAVYMGHWMSPAKRFVARYRQELASRSVWLFSSGPIGDPAIPKEEAADVREIASVTTARARRTFAGKLEREDLTLPEKAMVAALRAPQGDFRDWQDVSNWAETIADDLTASKPTWRTETAGSPEGGTSS